MDDHILTFVSITGANTDVARGFLQLAGGDFERAVGLYFENPDLVSGVGAGVSGGEASSASRAAATSRRRTMGTEDSSGVIHISDDDDDDDDENDVGGGNGGRHGDYDYDDDDDDDDDVMEVEGGHVGASVAAVAARAQEEEDAAMAKRLQEELYGGGQGSASGADDVRAPIARTTETLVAPDPSWGGAGAGGDEGMELLDQLRRQRHAPPRSGGPFGQRIWADSGSSAENGSHARRLEDLFRPPYDMMARVTWDEARALGKEDKKWILVNLQDMNDFNCQALNRDIWKDAAVRDIVSENFVFLQYDKDYPSSHEYLTFYFAHQSHENPDNYPHVSIVDPRTGEQVKVWSGRPFPSAAEFHAELAEFLDRYSLDPNSKNPVARATQKKAHVVDVDRMTEEEMLEMALKNSLAPATGGGASSASGSTPSIQDPDALTKSPGRGKGKEKEAAVAAGEAAQEPSPSPSPNPTPFARIASNRPHTEPDGNVAATTRIQFRHSNGRVIRRFQLGDAVRRIYEWLKAEPLAGKEGVEFELKKMPQGQDLLDMVDRTIEETGLKQGTVMVEFIEGE